MLDRKALHFSPPRETEGTLNIVYLQLLHSILTVLMPSLPIWAAMRIASSWLTDERLDLPREAMMAVLVGYSLLVAAITLMPMPMFSEGVMRVNLVPLVNLIDGFSPPPGAPPEYVFVHVRNIIGNTLLLMPVGFLLSVLWKRFRRLGQVFLVGLIFSTTIEVGQFAGQLLGNYRTADIDDVILNTAGACLGLAVYKAAKNLPSWFRRGGSRFGLTSVVERRNKHSS